MKSYIFIGGPWHGQTRDIDLNSSQSWVVPVPRQQFNSWSMEESFEPSFETVRYERRRMGISGTQRRFDYMILSTLHPKQAESMVDDYESVDDQSEPSSRMVNLPAAQPEYLLNSLANKIMGEPEDDPRNPFS